VRAKFLIRKPDLFFGKGGRVGGLAARMVSQGKGQGSFASVARGRTFVEIEVGTMPEAEGRRRFLLAGFESGMLRTSFTPGAKHVAVPLTGGARPIPAGPVPKEMTFAGMALRAYYKPPKGSVLAKVGKGKMRKLTRQTRSRKDLPVGMLGEYGRVAIPMHTPGILWRGKHGTFIMFTEKMPEGAVFERIGRGAGRSSRRMIWRFEPPFKLDQRLHWIELAVATANRVFPEEAKKALDDALSHEGAKLLRQVL
jgi:hypothetical protein